MEYYHLLLQKSSVQPAVVQVFVGLVLELVAVMVRLELAAPELRHWLQSLARHVRQRQLSVFPLELPALLRRQLAEPILQHLVLAVQLADCELNLVDYRIWR